MIIEVKTRINPTESKEKLLKACENIFPSMGFEEKDGYLEASGTDRNDLAAFKELLKIQEIRDTAKAVLEHRISENKLSFSLNKQAAFMGKVNFVDFPVALGTIEVRLEDDDLEGLVAWVRD
jgi:hypothetical protein